MTTHHSERVAACINRRLAWADRAVVVAAATALLLIAFGPTAHTTTMDCKHTGPIVGHPGMEYICSVHHPNDRMEIFYAPGPYAGP